MRTKLLLRKPLDNMQDFLGDLARENVTKVFSEHAARACIKVSPTQGTVKDFIERSLERISPGSPQDLLAKDFLDDFTRCFIFVYNSLPRACPKSIHGSGRQYRPQ